MSIPSDSNIHLMTPLEKVVSKILTVGVMISSAFLAVGIVVSLIQDHAAPGPKSFTHQLLKGKLSFPHSLIAVIRQIGEGRGSGLIALGLLLLLLTPIARVAGAFTLFTRNRNRAFATMTAIVLCILLMAFFAGTLFS